MRNWQKYMSLVPAVIADMYVRRGMNLKDIGAATGTTKSIIRRHLKLNGIPCRVGGGRHETDISGRKFDMVTVGSPVNEERGWTSLWTCRCDCGTEMVRERKWIVGQRGPHRPDRRVSCERCHYGREWRGQISSSHWTAVIRKAEERGLTVTTTHDEVANLFEQQQGRCTLTGWEISPGRTRGAGRTASLDRIDSTRGYDSGNVQWLHRDVNVAKWELTNGEFVGWCRLVHQPLPTDHLPPPPVYPMRCRPSSGYGGITGTTWSEIAGGARKKREFNLKAKDVWELFVSQRGACAFTGVPLILPDTRKLDRRYRTATLDRIDSSIGYVMGNLQWVHATVNCMKLDYSEEWFREMAVAVSAHHSNSPVVTPQLVHYRG